MVLATMAAPVTYLQRIFAGNRTDILENMGVSVRNLAPTWAAYYDLMEFYYQGNALYESLQKAAIQRGIKNRAIKGLRSPAFRSVEFYTGKLWPGSLPEALPIRTRNEDIIAPIQQVWTWSNWTNKKQVAARWIAMYGDLIIKVSQRGDRGEGNGRVYFELIKPRYVTELDLDERGYVTYIRLDIPQEDRVRDEVRRFTHTEVWSKDLGTYRVWEHDQAAGFDLDRLGDPDRTVELEEMGIDFVPFVYAPFRDIGEQRAANVFGLALDKIDEVNRLATQLHQIMFRHNRPIWAILSNMIDATRRPLPAPRPTGSAPVAPNADAEMVLQGEPVLYFPGLSKPELLIPNVAWDAYLKTIDAQVDDMADDLPEIRYYRTITEYKSDSGRALFYALSPAVDRALEVRGNIESALVRANQIALTLAIAAGYFARSIGAFESTDPTRNFEHSFMARPIIPLSPVDMAEGERTMNEALEREHNLGVPLEFLWQKKGYDRDQIAQIKRLAQQEHDENQQRQLDQMKALAAAQPPQQSQPGDAPGQAPADKPADTTQAAGPITTRSGRPPGRPPGSGVQSRNDPNISRNGRA